ncbi:purple acid phosphatase family protein [Gloeobacter violaceus]|uniref:Gll1963 protein n=1 Tax=Gloeobacter violaceus (strain ATCC 29082 / PCC 7421) TaxID=251221 RepID=Q7NJ69_GLOVI|nr:metallophosphoesterase family protein [Gloeobacter violaceus]BAC89904.1 gll1963 [Gloeobacter violaceus PCC 7421]
MRRRNVLGLSLLLLVGGAGKLAAVGATKIAYKPYIQPGDAGDFGTADQMVIAWQTEANGPDLYTVDFGKTPRYGRRVIARGRMVNHYLSSDPHLPQPSTASGARMNYHALLGGLEYETRYFYCVRGPGLPLEGFCASFYTRKRSGAFSFLVVGDQGFFHPSETQKPYLHKYQARIAYAMSRLEELKFPGTPALPRPDFILNTGDNVYIRGSEGNYRDYWMPVWNSDVAACDQGAPLARSLPIYVAIGNHDIGGAGDIVNLLADDAPVNPALPAVGERFSGALEGGDALAYFNNYYLPLNGPQGVDPQYIFDGDACRAEGFTFAYQGKTYRSPAAIEAYRASTTVPTLSGPRRQIDHMSNFSFDYANAHFVFLDANPHLFDARVGARNGSADKSPPFGYSPYPSVLLDWLIADLDRSEQLWKFVVYHQPAFSATATRDYQMRAIARVLEDHGANLVFNGHVHNYQRTHPLRAGRRVAEAPDTRGEPAVEVDTAFDGIGRTVPDGLIHIIEGSGGFTNSGKELEDSAVGRRSAEAGALPGGPAGWVDTHLTCAKMAPFVANAGRGPKITARFKARVFSFGNVVVDGDHLTLYQISEPLSATCSASAADPFPYGSDADGKALADPLADPLLDPATGELVTPATLGTPALLDKFTVTRPDLTGRLSVELHVPTGTTRSQTLPCRVRLVNRSPYALNGTQVVLGLPTGVTFAAYRGKERCTQHERSVVVTVGRLEKGAKKTVTIECFVAREAPPDVSQAITASVRTSTALPVVAKPVTLQGQSARRTAVR